MPRLRIILALLLILLFGSAVLLASELFNLLAPTGAAPQPNIQALGARLTPWNIIFRDEFEEAALDTAKWTPCYWWAIDGCSIITNDELEWYQPDDVLVSNGLVRLRAQERTGVGHEGAVYSYTSGMITTGRDTSDLTVAPRFIFQYGFAEIRARVPSGAGLWPAFWMLPADQNSRPEIDVMEFLGDDTHTVRMHFHYLDADGERQKNGEDWNGPDFADGLHTFGVDWQPDRIIWYVDGRERWRFPEAEHISVEPMYLLLNLAVGGEWPGPPDATTPFPSYFEIDCVRVWQRAAE